jgi:hypothetical protein
MQESISDGLLTGPGRRHRVEMRSRGVFRQWPAGLLAEIAAYTLVVVASSLIALLFARLA